MRAPRALARSGIPGEGRGAAGPSAPQIPRPLQRDSQVSGAGAEGPGGGLGAAAAPAERGEAEQHRPSRTPGLRSRTAELPGPGPGNACAGCPSPPGIAARPGPVREQGQGWAAPGPGVAGEQVRARRWPLLTAAQPWPCRRPLRCGCEEPGQSGDARGAAGAVPSAGGGGSPSAAPPAVALFLPPGSLFSPRALEHQLLFLLVTALLNLPTSTGDQSIVAVLGTYLGSNCFYEIDEVCLE